MPSVSLFDIDEMKDLVVVYCVSHYFVRYGGNEKDFGC